VCECLGVTCTVLTLARQYGDDEQTVPTPYALRVCGEIAALGAR